MPVLVLRASVTNYSRVFVATFEHYLRMKCSIFSTLIFHISWSFNSQLFYCTLIAANVRDIKGNCTIAGEELFLQQLWRAPTQKFMTLLLWNFQLNKSNLITKKSMSAICEIMNINAEFWIFWTLVIAYFWKNAKTQIKLKARIFLKIADTLLPRMLWFWRAP